MAHMDLNIELLVFELLADKLFYFTLMMHRSSWLYKIFACATYN